MQGIWYIRAVTAFTLFPLFAFSGAIAAGGKRVALVVGSAQYETVGRLANPAHDANGVAAALRPLNFDYVRPAIDAKYAEMHEARQTD